MSVSSPIHFLYISLFFLPFYSVSQDINYARVVIDTLCSSSMQGRGYTFEGDKIASKYIEYEFQKFNLKPFKNSTNSTGILYRQDYQISVNTFPYNTIVEIDNYRLKPGVDYLVAPNSGSVNETFKIIRFNKKLMDDKKKFRKFQKKKHTKHAIFVDKTGIEGDLNGAIFKLIAVNLVGAGAICRVEHGNLTWGSSLKKLHYPSLYISSRSIPMGSKKIKLNIKNDYKENYTTQNLIGHVEGIDKPDSFIVFTAHYDHLGRMGEIYFPGANDNASGIAMLLNLAQFYSKKENKQRYSIAFIAFSGEETGLSGSRYYTENPLFPLSNIKFLINLDLLGNGEKGMTVVNAILHEKEFKKLSEINEKEHYLPVIESRGKAQNSDHYYFAEKGVPAFFIYTMGGTKAYHDIYDKPETLTLSKFEAIFNLLREYVYWLCRG